MLTSYVGPFKQILRCVSIFSATFHLSKSCLNILTPYLLCVYAVYFVFIVPCKLCFTQNWTLTFDFKSLLGRHRLKVLGAGVGGGGEEYQEDLGSWHCYTVGIGSVSLGISGRRCRDSELFCIRGKGEVFIPNSHLSLANWTSPQEHQLHLPQTCALDGLSSALQLQKPIRPRESSAMPASSWGPAKETRVKRIGVQALIAHAVTSMTNPLPGFS